MKLAWFAFITCLVAFACNHSSAGKTGKNCPAGIPLCRCRKKGTVVCMKSNCLKRLPTGNITFEEGLKITGIVVSRQRSFRVIRSRDLAVLPNLKSARFFNNGIYAVLHGAFSNVPNLKRLDLHKNMLSAVPNEIRSLPNLKSLNLGGNKIKSIRPDVFVGNPLLKKLILKRNRIETFPSSLPPSLAKISIGDNLIPRFGDLRYLKGLKIIKAEQNRLTSIGADLLPSSLVELSVCRNRLTSTIESLDVSNLMHLRRLMLGGNIGIGPITQNTFFRGINSLQELGIGHSNIDVIHPDAFACLAHLRVVDMGGNLLRKVNFDWFHSNINLREVKVSGNPLECNCELVSSLESLNRKILNSFPRDSTGTFRSFAIDSSHIVCNDIDMRLATMQHGEMNKNYTSIVKSRCTIQGPSSGKKPICRHLAAPIASDKVVTRPKPTLFATRFIPSSTRSTATSTLRPTTSTLPPTTTTLPPRTSTLPPTTSTLPPTTTTLPPTTSTLPPTTSTLPPTTSTLPPTTTTLPPTTTTLPPTTTTLPPTTTTTTIPQTTTSTKLPVTTTLGNNAPDIQERFCTDDGVTCILPFVYDGVSYNECAPYRSSTTWTWCYTDDGGTWDYCAKCPELN
uniref:leucine-rich repeat and immunoglobulin-like domain-containing nogo receptor-interacting protein 3 isoform X2 n=1 Tax=Ciona intestinalis TaxID=7719 RepID=UPI000180CB29|nr:leucine-rich repeat and immunoglobulin-like domain-containing nogo receptor-interacting protein 3 isoform X2 [Ciona intestinalis]|eukprot:XP_002130298.1 leucine-rich repeat and immunoglobulin-like domain-containing nogo receptor-interacting protein 3 isoform X2 [Ciona intestinalis]